MAGIFNDQLLARFNFASVVQKCAKPRAFMRKTAYPTSLNTKPCVLQGQLAILPTGQLRRSCLPPLTGASWQCP